LAYGSSQWLRYAVTIVKFKLAVWTVRNLKEKKIIAVKSFSVRRKTNASTTSNVVIAGATVLLEQVY